MRFFPGVASIAIATMLLSTAAPAKTLTTANLLALHGLAGFSDLANTVAGKAALQSNLQITAAIQSGAARQPTLLPFAAQQEQALRDASITFGNGRELADGLGSKLGGAYNSLTSAQASETCKMLPLAAGRGVSPTVDHLIVYTATLTTGDAGAAKYFFSNGTVDGKAAMPPAAAAILAAYNGTTDQFGAAYNDKPGGKNADPFGDSRPFQTEPKLTIFQGTDYFGFKRSNRDYFGGPVQCLEKSPSFPSGHTTYGYTESLLLAFMVPERYSQMITRGAEYGNSRIIVGAHYAMDVIGGRSLALYDVAHLLAENPAYVGQSEGKGATPISNYAAALAQAKMDLRTALAKQCGGTIATCAADDHTRFNNESANAKFYQSTQTYGLPVVYPAQSGRLEDVAALAPEAGFLLTAAFPNLSLAQADDILTSTEGPGGGFLDNGSALGVYSRLDLYKAGLQAAAR